MEFELWKNENEICHAKDFILKQGDVVALKITILLEDLEKFYFLDLLKKEKIKKLSKEIYEIRIKVKGDAFRFLFAIRNNKGWILEAFKKKSDKIPSKHVRNAENRILILNEQIKNSLVK